MMSEKVNTLIKVLVALEKAGASEHDKYLPLAATLMTRLATRSTLLVKLSVLLTPAGLRTPLCL